MIRRIALLVAATLVLTAAWWLFAPRRAGAPGPYLGYVEAETVLVAPKAAGRLVGLKVAEGQTVAKGDPLFALDCDAEGAAVEAAAARVSQAKAQLADLERPQQRPEEIAVLEATLDQAKATADLSSADLERQERLNKQGTAAQAQLDQARAAAERDKAAIAQIERQIAVGRMSGRPDAVAAAKANVAAAEKTLAQAQVALSDRQVPAPAAGRVLDVFYRKGEVVPAGQAVAEILPPEDVLVRFYVPETAVAGLREGEGVEIACDGCASDLTGTITFIASDAEFTPPVIFSRQERSKLVFLVKARPTSGLSALKPGLPVEVRLE